MKKSLLTLAIAAGAIILIAPKIIANQSDQQILQAVEKIDSLPGYEASIVSTEKSWFSTQTNVSVALDPAQFAGATNAGTEQMSAMLELFQIDVEIAMQYGPVLINKGLGLSDIQIRVPNDSDKVKNDGEIVKNIYFFDGKLDLFGDIAYEDSFSAMQFAPDEEGSHISFSGYRGTGVVNNGLVDYAGSAPSFDITSPEMSASMSDLEITWEGDFDLAKLMKGIYGNSASKFSIADFDLTQAGQSVFGWQDLEFYINTKINAAELANMQAGYRIAALDTPIENFEDIEIAFEISNFDQQFMETYSQILLPMQTQQTIPDDLLNKIQPPIIAALAHQPELKLTNMGFKTSTGTFKSNATLSLADYDINPAQFQDPVFWQNNIVLESGLDLPKDMALDLAKKGLLMQFQADPAAASYTAEQLQEMATQQAEMTLNNFMQGGFLVAQNEQLQLRFNIAGGTANLNGNDIPLSAMLPAQ